MNQRRKLTKDERMAVYEKTNGHCAYCGCELEYKDMQVDHVIPINGWSEQGEDTLEQTTFQITCQLVGAATTTKADPP